MEYNISNAGNYNLLEILTHVNVYNCSELKKIFNSLIEQRIGNIAVFLHNNDDHMDSSVISAMISVHKKVSALGYKFALVIPNEEIISLLTLAGLNNYFIIYRSLNSLNEDI